MENKIFKFFDIMEKYGNINNESNESKSEYNIEYSDSINKPVVNEIPWIEKYRPKLLKDIVGNDSALERMKLMVEYGDIPNMILSGPSGVGKTTSILCLANEILGENYKDGVLELNASDARGIDIVRNKIKLFAQKKLVLSEGKFKIIILDEADSMTPAAQQALRRTIEIYSRTTRFILSCNTSTKIIEPIQSRCVIIRYSKLTNEELEKRLLEIVNIENIKDNLKKDGLESIIINSDGDLRTALNILQTTSLCFDIISSENIYKICDKPQHSVIQKIYEYCLNNNLEEAEKIISMLFKKGFAISDIISLLFKIVCKNEYKILVNENKRLKTLEIITNYHQRIIYGCSSELQLLGCISSICDLHK